MQESNPALAVFKLRHDELAIVAGDDLQAVKEQIRVLTCDPGELRGTHPVV